MLHSSSCLCLTPLFYICVRARASTLLRLVVVCLSHSLSFPRLIASQVSSLSLSLSRLFHIVSRLVVLASLRLHSMRIFSAARRGAKVSPLPPPLLPSFLASLRRNALGQGRPSTRNEKRTCQCCASHPSYGRCCSVSARDGAHCCQLSVCASAASVFFVYFAATRHVLVFRACL